MPQHILVVDDEPITCRVLAMLLESVGYRVTTANDGLSALRQMAADPPALVFLDLMMPEVDGFDVIQKAKSQPGLAHIPIVVLTAAGGSSYVDRALKLGAAKCFSKPFAKEKIFAAARELLPRAE